MVMWAQDRHPFTHALLEAHRRVVALQCAAKQATAATAGWLEFMVGSAYALANGMVAQLLLLAIPP